MAKVTVYKNSKFSTILSFLGYMGIVLGVYSCFNDELGIKVGIISLAIGFALKLLAGFISQKKSQREAKKKQNTQTKAE